MRALREMHVDIRKTALLSIAILGFLGVFLHSARARETVRLILGQNAYVFQESSGFPMGYPSREDGTGPVGGWQAGITVDLTLGPVRIACNNAALEVSQIADVVQAGRLFCADPDAIANVENLRAAITAAGNWDGFMDHTASPRRAAEFGTTLKEATNYIDSQPMRGRVMRVPLYSWRGDTSLLLELNVARHTDLSGAPSYELVFSWGASCLIPELVKQQSNGQNPSDQLRAKQRQAQLPNICDGEFRALSRRQGQ